MAGDWIKMRSNLNTHPKVARMARAIETCREAGKSLSTGFNGALCEIVTRDVTRDVTLASLFRVWSAANEHTSDGVWHGINLDELDHIAGVPNFGQMMAEVGWAVFDEVADTVTFPNFLEYNAPAKEGRGGAAAERQRRYRERRQKSDVTDNVTRDVTPIITRDVTRDVEKRREENKNTDAASLLVLPFPSNDFLAVWEDWELHRKEKRVKLTPISRKKQFAILGGLTERHAIETLNKSIANGWTGLFPDKAATTEYPTKPLFRPV